MAAMLPEALAVGRVLGLPQASGQGLREQGDSPPQATLELVIDAGEKGAGPVIPVPLQVEHARIGAAVGVGHVEDLDPEGYARGIEVVSDGRYEGDGRFGG